MVIALNQQATNSGQFEIPKQSQPGLARRLRVALIMCAAPITLTLVPQTEAAASHRKIGLEGYCPLELIEHGKLTKGRSAWSSRFDGTTYFFSSRANQRAFNRSPELYVPALGGDCTVCYAKTGKRVPGRLRYASLHNGRLYLFPGFAERREFQQNPKAYENIDLVADGDSVVWLIHGRRRISGAEEHSEIYNGFRYHFASMRDQFEFRRFRNRYERLSMMLDPDVDQSRMQTNTFQPVRYTAPTPPQPTQASFPDPKLRQLLSVNSLNVLLSR